MRKLLYTTALALCLGGTAVHADMKPVSHSGYWTSDAGTNDHGYPMCMVSSYGYANDGSVISIMIKYDTEHPDWMAYQLFKQSWHIPANQRVRVALKVDNAPGRVFTGTQWARSDMIDFEIQLGALDPQTGEQEITYIANLLREGRLLRISFPDGNENDWGANLTGANQALNTMTGCISYLAERAGQGSQSATQPYAGGGQRRQLPDTQRTTQPYTPL